MTDNNTPEPQGDPGTRPQSGLRTAARAAGTAIDVGVVIGYGAIYTLLFVVSAVVAFAANGALFYGLAAMALFGWLAWKHWRQLIH